MCGFVGFVDFEKDISQNTKILENMNNCLAKRGPDEEGYYRLYQLEHPTQPVSAQRFAQIGHFFEEVTLAQEFPDSPILIINRKGKIINDIGISLHYDIV